MTLTGLSSVFWLGGGSGAGKTTIARAVSGHLDLRVYHVDARGYDHVARMSEGPFPRTRAFNAKSYDDRWLREPQVLADDFFAISRERMPLVVEDLVALGPGPSIVAEGPRLLPELVAPLLHDPGEGLWLLPTPEFGARGVAARGELVPTAAAAQATENRRQRDVIVTRTLGEQAAQHGLASVTVDGQRSLEETVDWLTRRVLALPGLRRAESGEQRAALRRQENDVVARQLTAYWQDVGQQDMPDAPRGPFSCECRRLGCAAELMLAVDEVRMRRMSGPLLVHQR